MEHKMKHTIEAGDIVSVNFNNSKFTLSKRAEVIFTPCSIGDNWVFKDIETGDIHYVSEGCTISFEQPNAQSDTIATLRDALRRQST